MTQSRGRIVLILGMHRSGTSMLARLLAAQGLPLGTTLRRRRSRDNAHGYWEQAEIVQIHEALLDRFDRTWHGPNGLRPLPEGWLHDPDTRMAKRKLAAIADRELSLAGGLWGFKDPRTLRFLPLWREIIAEMALDPVFILAARSPAAVTASLMQRNRLGHDFAEALWAANTLTLLAAVGGELAAVVDYDTWFVRPATIAAHLRRAAGLAQTVPQAAPWNAALVDPNLRHHHCTTVSVRPEFQALHTALVASAPRPPAEAAFATAIAGATTILDSLS